MFDVMLRLLFVVSVVFLMSVIGVYFGLDPYAVPFAAAILFVFVTIILD